MIRKIEMLPPLIGLLLVSCFGFSMQGLMSGTGREWFPVVPLRLEHGVDVTYRGQYHQDPRFLQLLADMARLRREALATAQLRIGIFTDDPDGFAVRFKDTSEYGAASRPVRAEQRDLSLVSLSAEQAVLGVMDIRASLIHEFIHCLMRKEMGEKSYQALPAWVREGLAVWGAGQLAERSRNLVAGVFMDQDAPAPAGFWNHAGMMPASERRLARAARYSAPTLEVNTGWLQADSYLLDALTFEWLSQTQGEAAVRELVAELLAGVGAERALEKISGYNLAQVRAARLSFARLYFDDVLLASGLEEFRHARRALARGDRLGAIAWLTRLVDDHSDSVLVPTAWYRIGRLCEKVGWFERAVTAYGQVVDHHAHHFGLQADSRLRLADCLLRLGRYERAASVAGRFLALHPRAPRDQRARARRLTAAVMVPVAAGVHAP